MSTTNTNENDDKSSSMLSATSIEPGISETIEGPNIIKEDAASSEPGASETIEEPKHNKEDAEPVELEVSETTEEPNTKKEAEVEENEEEIILWALFKAEQDDKLGTMIPSDPLLRSKALAKAVSKFLCIRFKDELIERMTKYLKKTNPSATKGELVFWWAHSIPKNLYKKVLQLKFPKKKDPDKMPKARWCLTVAGGVVKNLEAEGLIQVESVTKSTKEETESVHKQPVNEANVRAAGTASVNSDKGTQVMAGSDADTKPSNGRFGMLPVPKSPITESNDPRESTVDQLTRTAYEEASGASFLKGDGNKTSTAQPGAHELRYHYPSGDSSVDDRHSSATKQTSSSGVNPVQQTSSSGMNPILALDGMNRPTFAPRMHKSSNQITINLYSDMDKAPYQGVFVAFSWSDVTSDSSISIVRHVYGSRVELGVPSPVRILLLELPSTPKDEIAAIQRLKFFTDAHRESTLKYPLYFEPIIDMIPGIQIGMIRYAMITMDGSAMSLSAYLAQNVTRLRANPSLVRDLARQLLIGGAFGLRKTKQAVLHLLSPSLDIVARETNEGPQGPILRFCPLVHHAYATPDWSVPCGISFHKNIGYVLAFIVSLGTWRPVHMEPDLHPDQHVLLKAVSQVLRGDLKDPRIPISLGEACSHPGFWSNREIVTFITNFVESLPLPVRSRLDWTFRPVVLSSNPVLYRYLLSSLNSRETAEAGTKEPHSTCSVSELLRLARNAFSHFHPRQSFVSEDPYVATKFSLTRDVEQSARLLFDHVPGLFVDLWETRRSFGWEVVMDPFSGSLVFEFGVVHNSEEI